MGRDRLTAPLHHSVVSALRANSRGIWLRQGVKDQTERLPSREPRRIFLCLQIPTGVQPGIIQLKGLDFWKQTSLVLVQNWTGAEELFPSAILKTKSQRMDSDPQPPTPFLRSTWVYRPVLWHKIIKAPPPKKKKKLGQEVWLSQSLDYQLHTTFFSPQTRIMDPQTPHPIHAHVWLSPFAAHMKLS